MGHARLKSIKAGQPVTVDFAAPEMFVQRGDRANLSRGEDGVVDESRVVPRAVRIVIVNCIAAAFPQGVDRRDGKVWAAWQEAIADESPDQVEMTRGDAEWLRSQLAKDDLKVAVTLASWRESVIEYLDGLLPLVHDAVLHV